MRTLAAISVGAIGIAFFGCYILPTVLAWLVLVTVNSFAPSLIEGSLATVMGLFILWAIFLAPMFAGYFVAHLSKVLPLLHGLIVSVLGSVLWTVYMTLTGNAGWLALLVVPPVMLAGLCGAWFHRYRANRRSPTAVS